MSAFHAYDIRGIWQEDFNEDDVYKIGFYLVQIFNVKKVLIGRDVRTSSPIIHERLTEGLIDGGAHVYDAGLTTTPMIYWGTATYDFDLSVMITASHNPAQYNGLKVSGPKATPIGYENGLKLVEQAMQTPPRPTVPKGKVSSFNYKGEYINFLKKYVKFLEVPLVIDCSNGMASILVKDIFGNKPTYLFDELDGTFPNHEPNPLVPSNIVALREKVKEVGAAFGMIFDGDADRVMFVDEMGNFIPPDLLIALLGHYFLEERGEKGKVVVDIRTSKAVGEYLKPMGGEVVIWRVGRAYAATKLKEINGVYGGELAGHYYFRDFFYSDSGMLSAILMSNLFQKFIQQGKKVSDIIQSIKKYENSGEINYKIDQKKAPIDAVVQHFIHEKKPDVILDFDGYRLEYPDWWFNIRPSNTEPYLRLLLEATSKELLQEKLSIIDSIIKKFI
ncbi:MAG: phosphomannomutase/phosphoglucomutase [Bacteroidales bacterium]|nr:phosphomannomutase/phosphoglucomutase [Bacteroidales bacterium]